MRGLSWILAMCAVLTIPAWAGDAAAPEASPLPYTPGLDPGSLDRSISPCVDFYQFSCGGWLKKNPLPADQATWSVYGKLEEENRAFLHQILEDASKPSPNRNAAEQKIGDYYAACMDASAVNAAGAKPLQADLDRIAALSNIRDLAAFLAVYHPEDTQTNSPNSAVFSFTSAQDFKNSTQYVASADQGGLGLPDRDYYLKTDPQSVQLRNAYLAYVQRMFELLGDKPEVAAANAQTVLRVETALAQGSQTLVARRDPNNLNHKMSRAELQALTPSFDWQRYLEGVGLGNISSLNVASPGYFKTLQTQLSGEPLDHWKTYLRFHLADARAEYLSDEFVNAHFEFANKTLFGQKELQARWKRCEQQVDRDLGEALGQAYVAKTFSPERKAAAQKIVAEIEAAMERDIRDLPWMSDTTKQAALQKLHQIRNKVGYPDHWRDYSSLSIERSDAVGNVQRSAAFEFHRQLAKIGKPIDRGEWDITAATVDAYYNPQMNDINFPAGVLQPPLYDPHMDDAVNYGDTGSTIGHELTHGFDDEGRRFDGEGNLRDWWTPGDVNEFEKRANCIVDQYAQYTVVDDIKINSKLTLGEDIADLGGLILAYVAWKEETRDQKLAGADGFTPEQRFFVGYAQQWCNNATPEALRVRAATNPHSPPKCRTNGVVTNMPEFIEAFGCKKGQPMVRETQCRVW